MASLNVTSSNYLLLLMSCLLVCSCSIQEQQQHWSLDQQQSIAGHATTVKGRPQLIEGKSGEQALEFNGINDGLLIDHNPIEGAEAFSIEVLLKPYQAYPENKEQRFLHIQDPTNDQRRILMELRLNSSGGWYPDFFMKTENAALTLIDSTKTLPVNEWATMMLVYRDKQLKGYLNGREILAGDIEYLPIGRAGKTALGVRMNEVSWYKGAIQWVRFKKGDQLR